MRLEGRHVLVTGGTRGLGRALAEGALGRGARVTVSARDRRALTALEREAPGLLALRADMGRARDLERLLTLAVDRHGPVDVLLLNAATLGEVPLPLLLDAAPGSARRTFEVNTLGPLTLARRVAPGMVLAGGGVVAAISSDAAHGHWPGWGLYGASKAALEHLTLTLGEELAGTGVRALVADPGEMDTVMHADAVPDADRARLARPVDVARWLLDLIEQGGSSARVARGEAT